MDIQQACDRITAVTVTIRSSRERARIARRSVLDVKPPAPVGVRQPTPSVLRARHLIDEMSEIEAFYRMPVIDRLNEPLGAYKLTD